MIKKYLTAGATVVSLLALPMFALAAGTDVTLTTDVVVIAGGVTFNVTGSSAVLSSITVSDGNFSIVLDTGSSATIKTADNSRIGDDAASGNISASTCTSGSSTKTYTAATGLPATITISPNSIICSSGSSFVSSPTPVSSGGGGGSSSSAPATPVVPTPAPTPAVVVPVTQTPVVPAIINAKPSKVAVAVSPVFTRAFAKNQKHADVKRLQQLLTLDLGVALKTTGKFDLATQKALMNFQEKYGLAMKGKVGYGSFGPVTRAKFAALFELQKPVPKKAVTKTDVQSLLDKVKMLQGQLKNQ